MSTSSTLEDAHTAPATMKTYPYPSMLDTSNFVSLQLSSDNYVPWRTQILGLIESQDLQGFPDGTEQPPDPATTENPAYLAWRRSDRLVRGWILGSLSPDSLHAVVGLESSKDVWDALQNVHIGHPPTLDEYFILLQKLKSVRKEPWMSLHQYLRQFIAACAEFSVKSRRPLKDEEKVKTLLFGLGREYDVFTTSMLKPPVPDYKSLISQLLSYDARISLMDENQNAAEEKPVTWCQICGSQNHEALVCPHRYD